VSLQVFNAAVQFVNERLPSNDYSLYEHGGTGVSIISNRSLAGKLVKGQEDTELMCIHRPMYGTTEVLHLDMGDPTSFDKLEAWLITIIAADNVIHAKC
jgi:hypothetical protein